MLRSWLSLLFIYLYVVLFCTCFGSSLFDLLVCVLVGCSVCLWLMFTRGTDFEIVFRCCCCLVILVCRCCFGDWNDYIIANSEWILCPHVFWRYVKCGGTNDK